MDRLLTIKEVSTLLQVKEKTLYAWVGEKSIPHLKLNGCVRFKESDMLTWMDSCRKEPQVVKMPLLRLPQKPQKKGGQS